jgi:hypothetical protein
MHTLTVCSLHIARQPFLRDGHGRLGCCEVNSFASHVVRLRFSCALLMQCNIAGMVTMSHGKVATSWWKHLNVRGLGTCLHIQGALPWRSIKL